MPMFWPKARLTGRLSGLWVLLDTTPDGRRTDWYPKLEMNPSRIEAALRG